MPNQPLPIVLLLKRLWYHISTYRRSQFGLLLIIMILASFAEMVSIGLVLPFLGVLTAPESIFSHPLAQPINNLLGFHEPTQLLLPLTIAFGLAIIISGIMRLLLLWVGIRLSFATGADLSLNIYWRTLNQPYTVHCARNSSEVISSVSDKANGVIHSIIMPSLTLISSSVMLISILIALITIEPTIALTAFGGFGLIYILIIRITRKQLIVDSQRIARESINVIKSLQEGLGGIRDVLINGSQSIYCEIYRNADLPLRQAQGNNIFISTCPRFGMEALGMLLISALAYALVQQEDGFSRAIPILGAMALGAQRLLPVLQQAYAAWSSIRGGQASLQDTLEMLDQPAPLDEDQLFAQKLPFESNILLKQIGFRYSPTTPFVIKHLDLRIEKGSRIGFIGTTGSGKSTLLDILMGLLQPSEGTIEVDGEAIVAANNRSWQSHIAHVPQAIFLTDSTIEQNIAFGIPQDQIDHERVMRAAQQAQIAGVINSWPKRFKTNVGERGVRLSGGQRQRIGLARALYKQSDIIVLDEATSALDNNTEEEVIQAIAGLDHNITILMVAHRHTTLKNCTEIVELENGKIIRKGTYQQILGKLA